MENEETLKETCKQVEEQIRQLNEQGIQSDTLEYLYKLVDIHKDLKNEKYWKEKIKIMRYGNYGNYGEYGEYGDYGEYNAGGNYGRRGRDSRGRYSEGYGARGYDAKYRGEDTLNYMQGTYGRYMESRERYGAGEETDKSFHYMVKALEDFIQVLYEEANSQEQKQMLRETLQKSMM